MSPRRKRLKRIRWVNKRGWVTAEEVYRWKLGRLRRYPKGWQRFLFSSKTRTLGITWIPLDNMAVWVKQDTPIAKAVFGAGYRYYSVRGAEKYEYSTTGSVPEVSS